MSKSLSLVQKRNVEMSSSILSDEVLEQIYYQHSVLCQTCMPYRDPGDHVRVWEQQQGNVALSIEAGKVHDPETNQWIEMGLPFGPKARLILAHLNTKALKADSPEIKVERSLTAFVRRLHDPTKRGKLGPSGYQIRMFKEQLTRLSVASIHMAMKTDDKHTVQINSQLTDTIKLWLEEDESRKIIWSPTIHLNHKYFDSLQKHAVPLDERALAALAHSAMALDIYAWLAQRLHRVPHEKPQLITWVTVKKQFGMGFGRMNDFKQRFIPAMDQVIACYPTAKIEIDRTGVLLRHSPPPVAKRLQAISPLTNDQCLQDAS